MIVMMVKRSILANFVQPFATLEMSPLYVTACILGGLSWRSWVSSQGTRVHHHSLQV